VWPSERRSVFLRNILPLNLFVACLAYISTVKMEAICSSKPSVDFHQTIWCYIPECCDYVSNLVVSWLPVEVARQRVLL
jgi:hypothetical protein